MEKLKEVISILSGKGGVGKTTSVISLAGAILRTSRHSRILIVDLDSQGNASALLGWDSSQRSKTIFDSLRDRSSIPVYDTNIQSKIGTGGIFLSPSHPLLASVDIELVRRMQPKVVLRKCFSQSIENYSSASLPDDITEAFDFIFIDCPPAINDITYNAMSVSDSVIVPVQAERLSMDGVSASLDAILEFQEELKPDLRIRGILLTMLDERTTAARKLSDVVMRMYGDMVMDVKIKRCTKVVEAQALGEDLYSYAPYCSTAINYLHLAKSIINDHK